MGFLAGAPALCKNQYVLLVLRKKTHDSCTYGATLDRCGLSQPARLKLAESQYLERVCSLLLLLLLLLPNAAHHLVRPPERAVTMVWVRFKWWQPSIAVAVASAALRLAATGTLTARPRLAPALGRPVKAHGPRSAR